MEFESFFLPISGRFYVFMAFHVLETLDSTSECHVLTISCGYLALQRICVQWQES